MVVVGRGLEQRYALRGWREWAVDRKSMAVAVAEGRGLDQGCALRRLIWWREWAAARKRRTVAVGGGFEQGYALRRWREWAAARKRRVTVGRGCRGLGEEGALRRWREWAATERATAERVAAAMVAVVIAAEGMAPVAAAAATAAEGGVAEAMTAAARAAAEGLLRLGVTRGALHWRDAIRVAAGFTRGCRASGGGGALRRWREWAVAEGLLRQRQERCGTLYLRDALGGVTSNLRDTRQLTPQKAEAAERITPTQQPTIRGTALLQCFPGVAPQPGRLGFTRPSWAARQFTISALSLWCDRWAELRGPFSLHARSLDARRRFRRRWLAAATSQWRIHSIALGCGRTALRMAETAWRARQRRAPPVRGIYRYLAIRYIDIDIDR